MKGHLSSNAPSGFLLKRSTSERSGYLVPSPNSDICLAWLSTHAYD